MDSPPPLPTSPGADSETDDCDSLVDFDGRRDVSTSPPRRKCLGSASAETVNIDECLVSRQTEKTDDSALPSPRRFHFGHDEIEEDAVTFPTKPDRIGEPTSPYMGVTKRDDRNCESSEVIVPSESSPASSRIHADAEVNGVIDLASFDSAVSDSDASQWETSEVDEFTSNSDIDAGATNGVGTPPRSQSATEEHRHFPEVVASSSDAVFLRCNEPSYREVGCVGRECEDCSAAGENVGIVEELKVGETNRNDKEFSEEIKFVEELKANDEIKIVEELKANDEIKFVEELKANDEIKFVEELKANDEIKIVEELKANDEIKIVEELKANDEIKIVEELKAKDEIKIVEELKAKVETKFVEEPKANDKTKFIEELKANDETKFVEEPKANDEIGEVKCDEILNESVHCNSDSKYLTFVEDDAEFASFTSFTSFSENVKLESAADEWSSTSTSNYKSSQNQLSEHEDEDDDWAAFSNTTSTNKVITNDQEDFEDFGNFTKPEENKLSLRNAVNDDKVITNDQEDFEDFGNFTKPEENKLSLRNEVNDDNFGDFEDFTKAVPIVKVDKVIEFQSELLDNGYILNEIMSPIPVKILQDDSICTSDSVIWDNVFNVEEAKSLKFAWQKCRHYDFLLTSICVDPRNMLPKHVNPVFSGENALLKPTPYTPLDQSTPAHETILDTSEKMASDIPKSPIPDAEFNWNDSGLTNPLDAYNVQTSLDILEHSELFDNYVPKPSLGSRKTQEILDAIEVNAVAEPRSTVEKKPVGQSSIDGLMAKIAAVESSSAVGVPSKPDSRAKSYISRLRDIHFMRSTSLIFPLKES